MHFTSFVTFSNLIWKNTAEDEEYVLAEVCSCDMSKKIHFLHHGKNKTKHFLTQQKKIRNPKTQNSQLVSETNKKKQNHKPNNKK